MAKNKGNHSRSTDEEIEERIQFTLGLLAQGFFKSTIKKMVREKFGDVDARTVEFYLSRSREILVEALRQDRESHKSSALGFYQSVLTDPEVKIGDKIRAQSRIDFILGLNSPAKVSFTDADGKTLGRNEVETAIDSLAEGLLRAGATGETA